VDAVAQDDPGAEEPDAGHDVGGDPGRVDAMLAGQQDGEQLEHSGAEGDQGVGAQPGGALPPLPFQPDHRPQDQGDRGPGGEVPDAGLRHPGQEPSHHNPLSRAIVVLGGPRSNPLAGQYRWPAGRGRRGPGVRQWMKELKILTVISSTEAIR